MDNLDQTCPICLGQGDIIEWTANLAPEPSEVKSSVRSNIKDWMKNNIDYFILAFSSVIATLVILVPRHIKGSLSDIKAIPIFYIIIFLIFLGIFSLIFKAFDILGILLDKPIEKLVRATMNRSKKK